MQPLNLLLWGLGAALIVYLMQRRGVRPRSY